VFIFRFALGQTHPNVMFSFMNDDVHVREYVCWCLFLRLHLRMCLCLCLLYACLCSVAISVLLSASESESVSACMSVHVWMRACVCVCKAVDLCRKLSLRKQINPIFPMCMRTW